MPIMFGQKFLQDENRKEQRQAWQQAIMGNDRIGITRAVKGVIYREGVYEDLDKISTPTLIIVGDQDVATEPDKADRIHARIPNSKLMMIPGAGHTSTVEEPDAVNAALRDFLKF